MDKRRLDGEKTDQENDGDLVIRLREKTSTFICRNQVNTKYKIWCRCHHGRGLLLHFTAGPLTG